MKKHFRARQLPGRIEALRLVLKQGAANSSLQLKQLAGMGVWHGPMPTRPALAAATLSSGIDNATPAERAELPF